MKNLIIHVLFAQVIYCCSIVHENENIKTQNTTISNKLHKQKYIIKSQKRKMNHKTKL